MPEAIAEVREMQPNGKWSSCGTAFAVSQQLALTAFHVIGDRIQGKVRDKPLQLRFPNGCTRGVKYDDGDGQLDFALLALEPPLAEDFHPIALTDTAHEADGFISRGFPLVAEVNALTIGGTIRNLEATIFDRVPAMQLYSHEAGAELPLGGMSGAPVLVGSGEERAAIGLIRWNPTRQNDPTLSAGGTLFACPVRAIAERKPELRTAFRLISTPLPAAVLHNLPFVSNPLFTGREVALERLRGSLQGHGGNQKLTVHGLGGVGKTQLAIQYAYKYLREFDAVLWVEAETPEGFEVSLAALVFVLRLPEAKEREQTIQTQAVVNWLREHKHWLVIADHVDTEASVDAVRKRLWGGLPGAVLVTSRLSNWPVTIPHFELELLSPEEATKYLLDRVVVKARHNAGDETAARSLAGDLGYLPLALEVAAASITEMRWSFDKYREQFREARPELLSHEAEGGTVHPASVAKTWKITLGQLHPLARAVLRIAAWFAPDTIPRRIFSVNKEVLSEASREQATPSEIAIENALRELGRFSLIRLTEKTVSVHPLLQAVEQDSLGEAERKQFLLCALRLFDTFAPERANDVRTWDVWLPLSAHAEALIQHTKRQGIDTPLVASMEDKFGLFLNGRAAYAQAEPLLERALTIREKALGPEHSDVAKSLNNLANLCADRGQYARAEPLCRRALAIRRKALGPGHRDVAESANNLAALYAGQGKYKKAERLYKRALAIWKKALGPEDPDVAYSLNGLGTFYNSQGKWGKAEALYQQALTIREKALGPQCPEVARSLDYLGSLYTDQDKYGQAESFYRRAHKIRKTVDPEHPDVALSLDYLATLYANQGKYIKAASFYKRAWTIRKRRLGPDCPEVARSLNYLAALYAGQGDYVNAEPLYKRALAIREKALGPEHPDVAKSLYTLVELYRAQDQYGKAEPLCRLALTIRQKALGPDHPEVAESANNLAVLYADQRQYGKAEALYQQALTIREKALGPEHLDVAKSLNNLGILYAEQGQYTRAEHLCRRALAIQEKALGPDHHDVVESASNLASLLCRLNVNG
jgi:tetratricopeptide (TPR) repeat protein